MTARETLREAQNRIYAPRTEEDKLDGYRKSVLIDLIRLLREEGAAFGSVLDVCCGTGAFLRALREEFSFRDGVGIDISHVQIEKANARENPPGIAFERCDFAEFNPVREFDLVAAWSAYLHIPPRRVALFAQRVSDWAAKYVVLVNPTWDGPGGRGRGGPNPKDPQWRHDNRKFLACAKEKKWELAREAEIDLNHPPRVRMEVLLWRRG